MLTLISFVGSALPISLTFGTALRKLPGRMVFAVVSAIPSPLFRPYKKPLLSVNGASIISNSHLIRVTPFRTDAQSINECPPEAAWQADDAVLQSGRLSPYRSTWTKPVAPAKSPRLWPPPAQPFVRIAPGSREPEIELRTSVARQKSAPRMFAGHTRRAFVSTAVSAADGQVMKLAHRGFLNS